MRILVTGGAGFAGRHLLRELLSEPGHEITATVFGDESGAGPPLSDLPGVQWLPMDITDRESVDYVVRTVRPEQVYHLAGQASVGDSFEAPLSTWEVNATGTLRLMDSLRREWPEAGRVLLASSAEVYGAVPAGEQPIPEGRRYWPVTPYGASKAAAEVAALQAGRGAGIDVVVARNFNNVGPGQDDRFVLPSIARQVCRGSRGDGQVIRVGNLEVYRDLTDVRDGARAFLLLMNRGEAGEAYNVCSGRSHSLLEVVRRLIEISGAGATLEVDQDRVRPADIPVLTGDPSRLDALGWTPAIGLDDTLKDLLAESASR